MSCRLAPHTFDTNYHPQLMGYIKQCKYISLHPLPTFSPRSAIATTLSLSHRGWRRRNIDHSLVSSSLPCIKTYIITSLPFTYITTPINNTGLAISPPAGSTKTTHPVIPLLYVVHSFLTQSPWRHQSPCPPRAACSTPSKESLHARRRTIHQIAQRPMGQAPPRG
jgi:hypothetical protein